MRPLERVNDFVVKFANVNGSGSASANQLFAKSILRMGVPATPRNIFPSNIQGLPTWYEVRVSEANYLGARGGVDLMVAMNPQTWDDDVKSIDPGGYLFYNSTRPLTGPKIRGDITLIGVPLTAICNAEYTDSRQRQLFKNIMYVGALSALLDIEPEIIETLLAQQFKSKEKLIAANVHAFHLGRDYALANLACPIGLRIRKSDKVGDRIFLEGNAAAGLGAVYGGATVCAWYPITPSTSLAEAFTSYCERFRVDPATNKKKFAIIQAEDELASIGIVIGAGWNGARAFTATSGPGISLMQEFLGLSYFAEIPAVIFDVQRAGPSTGMPTRTQQCDITACAYASHGDTKHVLLFPEDPHECFTFGRISLRLGGPAADGDLRLARSRHRHERASLRPARLGRHPPDGPRQGDDGRRARGRADLRPLPGRGWGRHSLPHLSRHPPLARRLFHPRHQPGPVCALYRGRRRLPGQHGAAAQEVCDRAQPGAAADPAKRPPNRQSSA